MENKIQLSWQDIGRLTEELAGSIAASGFKPDCLVGITVGGLVPLVLLAKKLGVHEVLTISASSYSAAGKGELTVWNIPPADLAGRSVLLVDEIADTGDTLREVVRTLKERCNAHTLRTATLAVRSDTCTTKPDFSVLEVDRWVIFPWD